MAIALTGTGGLYTRIGQIIGGINEVQTLINTTLLDRVDDIDDEFEAAQQQLVDGIYSERDSYRATHDSWLSYLRTLAQNTLIQMADDDGTGINPLTLEEAIQKLAAQMTSATTSLVRPTIAATPSAGSSNVGNGSLIVSLVDADGKPVDHVFAETITGTCVDDAYAGSATAGQESWSFVGEVAVEDFDFNWPGGSDANQTLTAVNPSLTSGLILTDGDFENWTSNAPDDWDIIVGTAGTTISRGSSPHTGTYDLLFTGDGSQLTCIRQEVSLEANTVYAFHGWAKTDGSVAAGVLRIRLVDGSNTVFNDKEGTANSFNTTISGLTSSYTPIYAFFRTPPVLPTTTKIEIALTTALTNTEVLHMDRFALVEATQLYTGGPWVALFGGSTNFAINDTFTIAVTNSHGTTNFSRQVDRLFGLRELGLKIPSSTGGTQISDGLIN